MGEKLIQSIIWKRVHSGTLYYQYFPFILKIYIKIQIYEMSRLHKECSGYVKCESYKLNDNLLYFILLLKSA